jgi:hypothetical protein
VQYSIHIKQLKCHHFNGQHTNTNWVCEGSEIARNHICKGKGCPANTPSRHWDEVEVKLYPHSTPVLEGTGWPTACPSHLTPRKKTQYPTHMRLGRPFGQSEWVQKILPTNGVQTQDSPACRRWGSISVGLFKVDRKQAALPAQGTRTTQSMQRRKIRRNYFIINPKVHLFT